MQVNISAVAHELHAEFHGLLTPRRDEIAMASDQADDRVEDGAVCWFFCDDVKPRGLEAPVRSKSSESATFSKPDKYVPNQQSEKMETMQTDTSAGFFSTFLTKNKVVETPETSPKLTTGMYPS